MEEIRKSLVSEVARLQRRSVHITNNTYIFVQQAIPLLQEARNEIEVSKGSRRYYIPSVGTKQIAQRTDKQLQEIYDKFIDRELYENFIVTAVSRFEFFLFEVLRLVISAYPSKLTLNIKGVQTSRSVPLDLLLDSSDLQEAFDRIVSKRLYEVLYATPRSYLEYFSNITAVDTSRPIFFDYIEIKATRDLIIHNSGIVNEVYLSKVSDRKRGNVGEEIEINAEYFSHCIATLKRLARTINRDIERNFGKD